MVAERLNLLVIVGPTASGKTGLSIKIAKKYSGEIIAADSRTVYKGLDIGTAKPTVAEQQGLRHWGLDLVGPGEYFSVADFKQYATGIIKDTRARNNIPIIVGGTGLYVDALVYDFSLAEPNHELRQELAHLGVIELQDRIRDKNLPMPFNDQNKRHLIRTLERGNQPLHRNLLPKGTVIIGLNPPKHILEKRIRQRAEQMLNDGVLQEVDWALKHYPLDSEALTGGIYRIFRDVLWGKLTQEQAIELFVTSDKHLAKRQMSWFKRNKDICWFNGAEEALSWFDITFGGKLK